MIEQEVHELLYHPSVGHVPLPWLSLSSSERDADVSLDSPRTSANHNLIDFYI
jgi:hypothetical protein